MLETLHRIVQEVSAAEDFGEALRIIVERIAAATEADVCSVYLLEEDQQHLTLMATRGLYPDAVGRVRLRLEEGLVGLVAEREEPINLENADQHPRFRYFPETGEERFHSFLGVPIIHYRQRLGVLVVQRQGRQRFGDADVAFLVTMAAQLAGVVAHAKASGGLDLLAGHPEATRERPLVGVPGATGVGMGRGFVLYAPTALDEVPDRPVSDPEREEAAFLAAVQAVREDVEALAGRMHGTLPEGEQLLFDVYLRMLEGDSLVRQTCRRIKAGNWAAGAVRQTIAEQVRRFEEMEDPYLRERAGDVRDIGRRLVMRLLLVDEDRREIPQDAVLVGQEVSASQLAEVPLGRLAGVVSATGSANSHVAILARALGVPAVMGVADLQVRSLEGRELVVDGYRGRVYVDPPQAVRKEYRRLLRQEAELSAGLKSLQHERSITPDGVAIKLYVNTGLVADIGASREVGCDGVGLHRTEFPFMIRDRFPGEEEQAQLYREVLEAFAPLPVTLRTLDVGGDKTLPYFPIHDDNPFLGWRGIRMTLDHPEIFLTQIRAMLRASEGLGNLRIMFPMVSRLEEVEEARRLVERARRELAEEGVEAPAPLLGAMVEVPAAVYQAESLARRLDFLSVGSNDLAQYLLAVDRNNSRVASLYDELHPAVLRAVNEVAEVGRRMEVPVTVCGGMAGDPGIALLLLAMGMDGLSMSSAGLLRVKWAVRTVPYRDARRLLDRALGMEYPSEVRRLTNETLEAHGLGGLIRAGK
ncbi:phosphoenolpyruvate--protein phosphotransferase [Sediminicurvatus halobius]|uniref:phosphoenolpyruvate--protein phosphotransferase n=1 Tax=Sediminicurvatus halobius TaxID=2182432 RepID=A0A2U2MVZ0_9GAMM|nr:phosphoenolpyruvate--protein phosphotransferase [Spiribacter halobius]PWG61031.1 phosphoenolpyruvate-protein phosphotransferase PtsP [Spiribacter halobius]UEX77416.1 phosphoenolpyruvate--protein phosphotransferase [Spiribacter halobius]